LYDQSGDIKVTNKKPPIGVSKRKAKETIIPGYLKTFLVSNKFMQFSTSICLNLDLLIKDES